MRKRKGVWLSLFDTIPLQLCFRYLKWLKVVYFSHRLLPHFLYRLKPYQHLVEASLLSMVFQIQRRKCLLASHVTKLFTEMTWTPLTWVYVLQWRHSSWPRMFWEVFMNTRERYGYFLDLWLRSKRTPFFKLYPTSQSLSWHSLIPRYVSKQT